MWQVNNFPGVVTFEHLWLCMAVCMHERHIAGLLMVTGVVILAVGHGGLWSFYKAGDGGEQACFNLPWCSNLWAFVTSK